jgi:hypothetical protein
MTRDEVVAFCERIHEKLKRKDIQPRPISEARMARIDELRRQHEGDGI